MSAKSMIREPPSGIDLLVVGAGIGGLSAAIECHRKGHNVRVIEKRSDFSTFGDLIAITRSAQRTMLKWPGFLPRLQANAMPPRLWYFKFDGTELFSLSDIDKGKEGIISLTLWRNQLHEELYKYTSELEIPVTFSRQAVAYEEDDDSGSVLTAEGEKYVADLVIAADGIASKSIDMMPGEKETPTSSGYAIYRKSYPLDHALKDPDIARHWGGEVEGVQLFLGENLHLVTAKNSKTNSICYMLTHRDDNQSAVEAWQATCPAVDALRYLPENTPAYIAALFKQTPNNRCVNWKLVWRGPQPQWTSPKGRILQLGDACHPFIPTSGSGGTMAMEDSFSIAACLHIAGKTQIPLAVRVHNKLRFERVSFAQRNGFENREIWHHPKWDTIIKNPAVLGVVHSWMTEHDAEKYAYDNFAACAAHVTSGAAFQNTNTPPGKVYKPWTVRGLQLEADRNNRTSSKI